MYCHQHKKNGKNKHNFLLLSTSASIFRRLDGDTTLSLLSSGEENDNDAAPAGETVGEILTLGERLVGNWTEFLKEASWDGVMSKLR